MRVTSPGTVISPQISPRPASPLRGSTARLWQQGFVSLVRWPWLPTAASMGTGSSWRRTNGRMGSMTPGVIAFRRTCEKCSIKCGGKKCGIKCDQKSAASSATKYVSMCAREEGFSDNVNLGYYCCNCVEKHADFKSCSHCAARGRGRYSQAIYRECCSAHPRQRCRSDVHRPCARSCEYRCILVSSSCL